MTPLSQPQKIPVTKTPNLISIVLYGVSLALIFSPALVFVALNHIMPHYQQYQLNIISLVPFIIGIVLLVILRLKKML
jgi:tRNA A37 threonylcarbamoyltransferase TsaD